MADYNEPKLTKSKKGRSKKKEAEKPKAFLPTDMAPLSYPLGPPGNYDRRMAGPDTPTATSSGWINPSYIFPFSLNVSTPGQPEYLAKQIKERGFPADTPIRTKVDQYGRLIIIDGDLYQAALLSNTDALFTVTYMGNSDEYDQGHLPLKVTPPPTQSATVPPPPSLAVPTPPTVLVPSLTPTTQPSLKTQKELEVLTTPLTPPTPLVKKPSKPKKEKKETKEVLTGKAFEWADKWMAGEETMPSESIESVLAKYRPSKEVVLYRAIFPGEESLEKQKKLKAYTYDKELAMAAANVPESAVFDSTQPTGTVIERKIRTEDILVDFTQVPEWEREWGNEVVVLDKMAKTPKAPKKRESRKAVPERTSNTVSREKILMDIVTNDPSANLESLEQQFQDTEVFILKEVPISEIEEGIPDETTWEGEDGPPVVLDKKFGLVEGGPRVRSAINTGRNRIMAYVPSTLTLEEISGKSE